MNENRVEEVKSLVKKLNKYRDEYYNNNNSIISDREYDELFDKLIVLERETGCIFSNSPTQSVGYMSLSQLQKVKHSHPYYLLVRQQILMSLLSISATKIFLLWQNLMGLLAP